MKTPICIFSYKRRLELSKTLESLKNCKNIDSHPIFIFSDNAKNNKETTAVADVRNYIECLDFLKFEEVSFADQNKGLANSIIEGVTKIISDFGQVIVLEDDIIVSPNFLIFMESALEYYKNDTNIFSISGYSPNLKILENYNKDIYFSPRASSWGWGTWKDRWKKVDWDVKTYPSFKYDFVHQWKFTKGGIDLPGMLRDQMMGKINSWAIRWVYQQFLNNQATVYPKISKVRNIGIGENATHTKKTSRFRTIMDSGEQEVFAFESFDSYDPKIIKEFRSTFSIWRRLLDRL